MRLLVDPYSAEIPFVHSVTLQTLTVTAPLPPVMVVLMGRLRAASVSTPRP